MEDAIKARIEELEQYRTRLIAEASAEVQRVTGGLAELRRLLEVGGGLNEPTLKDSSTAE